MLYYCIYNNTQRLYLNLSVKPNLQEPSQHTLLVEVVNALNQINEKLDILIEFNVKILKINKKLIDKFNATYSANGCSVLTPDTLSLLSLPLALRKTVIALYQLERATADDLARETKRLRAVESAAANELVRMGYVKKKREGRDVYFYINSAEGAEN
jgi:ArsR family transcriptional regulator, lead/cadmium/zinc/bismuth-responsive transcriptional repressor